MNGDRISALFGLLFAFFILIESFRLDIGGLHQPGPGFFSMLGAILLGVLSTILLVQSILVKAKIRKSSGPPQKENPRVVFYLFLAFLVYALVFEWLGFILCTFLLAIFLLKLFERKKWWVVFLTSAVVSTATYSIFSVLLKSELPKGVLEVFF